MKTPVMPDSSKAWRSACFSAVHSWVLRAPCGDQPRHRPARHGAHRLDQHLQIEAIGKAPQDLADVVARQGAKVVRA